MEIDLFFVSSILDICAESKTREYGIEFRAANHPDAESTVADREAFQDSFFHTSASAGPALIMIALVAEAKASILPASAIAWKLSRQ
jgi:hypothetical protein